MYTPPGPSIARRINPSARASRSWADLPPSDFHAILRRRAQGPPPTLPYAYTQGYPMVGAGYVGGPTCAVIALKCPSAPTFTIVDLNKGRIDAWNIPDYKLPIHEPGLPQVVKAARERNLFFSTVDKAIEEADLIFVSVNTSTKKSGVGAGFSADLAYVESATCLAEVATSSKIVIEKSAMPCLTAESMRTILQANSKPGCRFDILSNPKFLAEGTAIDNLFAPDRVLVGSLQTPEGLSACQSLSAVYTNWAL
ncbi:UDP-glucose/GDP-mannose dehydrogenase family, NAD binding domain-containing protein [Amylostereum chailletii]|nr:UDP-glucose/GDP-mannose dehydrogenase family, NAD binding domain-containing protein [Amylostereum chailletii]